MNAPPISARSTASKTFSTATQYDRQWRQQTIVDLTNDIQVARQVDRWTLQRRQEHGERHDPPAAGLLKSSR